MSPLPPFPSNVAVAQVSAIRYSFNCWEDTEMSKAVQIKVRDSHARYVALSTDRAHRVIVEGRTAKSVARKARETGQNFSMMFLPKKGHTYIL